MFRGEKDDAIAFRDLLESSINGKGSPGISEILTPEMIAALNGRDGLGLSKVNASAPVSESYPRELSLFNIVPPSKDGLFTPDGMSKDTLMTPVSLPLNTAAIVSDPNPQYLHMLRNIQKEVDPRVRDELARRYEGINRYLKDQLYARNKNLRTTSYPVGAIGGTGDSVTVYDGNIGGQYLAKMMGTDFLESPVINNFINGVPWRVVHVSPDLTSGAINVGTVTGRHMPGSIYAVSSTEVGGKRGLARLSNHWNGLYAHDGSSVTSPVNEFRPVLGPRIVPTKTDHMFTGSDMQSGGFGLDLKGTLGSVFSGPSEEWLKNPTTGLGAVMNLTEGLGGQFPALNTRPYYLGVYWGESEPGAKGMTFQDTKGGESSKTVRADMEGGDTGAETSVSETPVAGQRGTTPQQGGPRIVINPEVFNDKRDALCVAMNEAFRILMETMGFDPSSEPTEKQRRFFSDTAYADDENMLRRTIIARIATFDTSVSDPTDEQVQETCEFLHYVMESGAPQNQWEQQAVQRIVDVLEKGGANRSGKGASRPHDSGEGGRADQAAIGAAGIDEDENEQNPSEQNPPEWDPTQGFDHVVSGGTDNSTSFGIHILSDGSAERWTRDAGGVWEKKDVLKDFKFTKETEDKPRGDMVDEVMRKTAGVKITEAANGKPATAVFNDNGTDVTYTFDDKTKKWSTSDTKKVETGFTSMSWTGQSGSQITARFDKNGNYVKKEKTAPVPGKTGTRASATFADTDFQHIVKGDDGMSYGLRKGDDGKIHNYRRNKDGSWTFQRSYDGGKMTTDADGNKTFSWTGKDGRTWSRNFDASGNIMARNDGQHRMHVENRLKKAGAYQDVGGEWRTKSGVRIRGNYNTWLDNFSQKDGRYYDVDGWRTRSGLRIS